MHTLSIAECQQALAALDAADQMTKNLKAEIERLQNFGTSDLMQKGMKMLMSKNLSLEALGLPPNLFEQIEQLNQLNTVARQRYRAVVTANLHQLESIEDAKVVNHG